MKDFIRKALASRGYKLMSTAQPDLEPEFVALQAEIAPFTMTSKERQHALYAAVNYIERCKIPGDIVECGVWKGGSTMLAARTLMARGSTERSIYLYDTYAGMSEPTPEDVNLHGSAAAGKWEESQQGAINTWDYASLEEVRANVSSTGYPQEKVHYVKGPVEETIPATLPNGSIALLRLDTDWYASTKHELVHLFPLLVPGGVLVIDDYGHWQGARQAVDEYFKETGIPILLNRIDYTGRIAVKVA